MTRFSEDTKLPYRKSLSVQASCRAELFLGIRLPHVLPSRGGLKGPGGTWLTPTQVGRRALQPLPRVGKGKQRDCTGTGKRRCLLWAWGLGTQAGGQGRLGRWRLSQSPSCSLELLLRTAAEVPPEGKGGFWRLQGAAPGARSWLSRFSCQASSTWVQVNFPGRASGRWLPLLVKGSPSYFSTAENRLSFRNSVTMAGTKSPPSEDLGHSSGWRGTGLAHHPGGRGVLQPQKAQTGSRGRHPRPAWAGRHARWAASPAASRRTARARMAMSPGGP